MTPAPILRSFARVVAVVLVAALPVLLSAQATKSLPLKYSGPPTKAPITREDLMTRLYVYADDSLMGRQVGTEYNVRATAYIEREVRRLGLKPGGDNGTFFQELPLMLRALDTTSTLTIDGQTFVAGRDFLARASTRPQQLQNVEVIYGGMALDTMNILANAAVRGKIVLLSPAQFGPGFDQIKFVASNGYQAYVASLQGAIVVAVGAEALSPNAVRNAVSPPTTTFVRTIEAPILLGITRRVADAMLGMSVDNATKGMTGRRVSSDVRFIDTPRPLGRNVVAILEGSDPKLRGQYVAVGAHNDHVGFSRRAVDHDSVKAFMQIVRPQGADNAPTEPTPEQLVQVRALTDSLRAVHGGARLDSIFNGADDDGSGTVAVLEVAEAMAAARVKPKRSVIFVWHSGEEAGLWGADHFTENPSVPRDSIVAQLNMDMVGRGAATDITGSAMDGGTLHGGAGYLQLVGSRRLSTELGDLIEKVNKDKQLGFTFDYGIDTNGHPQNIYCRSDHYMYARWGIPVTFMTTGGHADYHQVTDEPQYIDYARVRSVSLLVMESAMTVANLDHRIVVDKPKPDPRGQCVQ